MPYCAEADVKKRADLLTDFDSVALGNGIAWADALIDARLGGRYAVPFTSVPVIIREISADLAAYYCVFEAHTAGGEGAPVDGALELKNRAMDLLKQLQDGIALLPGVAGSGGAAPTPSILSTNSGPSPVRAFDLVSVPNILEPPFAPRQGWPQW